MLALKLFFLQIHFGMQILNFLLEVILLRSDPVFIFTNKFFILLLQVFNFL